MSKKKALGQGLDALLGGDIDISLSTTGKPSTEEGVQSISIDALRPNPDQPRQKFDEEALQELADSIRQQGVIQPILAEKRPNGDCFLIAGERRWRASRIAGLTEIPVIIRTFSAEQKLEIALVENIQREDLTPMEEARAYFRLMDTLNLSQQDVAKKVGKSRSTVANSLRLLKLPDVMKNAVEDGRLTAGHARALLAVTNPADQEQLFMKIINKTMSVRDAENTATDMNRGHKGRGEDRTLRPREEYRDPEMVRLEERFIEVFGTKVTMRGDFNKGRMEITWFNRADLDRIYELMIRDD